LAGHPYLHKSIQLGSPSTMSDHRGCICHRRRSRPYFSLCSHSLEDRRGKRSFLTDLCTCLRGKMKQMNRQCRARTHRLRQPCMSNHHCDSRRDICREERLHLSRLPTRRARKQRMHLQGPTMCRRQDFSFHLMRSYRQRQANIKCHHYRYKFRRGKLREHEHCRHKSFRLGSSGILSLNQG
jgi:hypothetical protein